MEVKAAALFVEVGAGTVTVSELCRRLQISRQSYYKYARRLAELGPEGLLEQSRRPHSSPSRTSAELVAAIVAAHSVLAQEGWDNGATSIAFRLLRDGVAAPSPRTIHRVLVREGLIVAQPRKRPRSSYRRFQFPCTDDCWQIDGWQTRLADGSTAVVIDILDDCSRYLVHSRACRTETTQDSWACMVEAIRRHGQPRLVLSDNSLAFTGRLEGHQVMFEKNLHQLGIRTIHAAPKHPQTCGKNERSHQTVHRWLAARPTPEDLPGLQTLLEDYRTAYNLRPHQALQGRTPLQQRTISRRPTTDLSPTSQQPPPAQPVITTPTANRQGAIKVGQTQIGLGVEYAHQPVIVFNTDNQLSIYYGQHLITELTLNPTRSYHATRPRGGPRRQRPHVA